MGAQVHLTARWQINAACGEDQPDGSALRAGERSKNQTYMTNLTFSFSPRVRSAWEWGRFLADYKTQPTANSISDHANMTVSYVY